MIINGQLDSSSKIYFYEREKKDYTFLQRLKYDFLYMFSKLISFILMIFIATAIWIVILPSATGIIKLIVAILFFLTGMTKSLFHLLANSK